MEIKELIKNIREQYMDAELDTLEVWQGQLSTEFAWIAQNLSEIKRDRAKKELAIKKGFVDSQISVTEKEIERQYFATEEGMYYAWASEILKSISKLISAVRFKIDALRGRI